MLVIALQAALGRRHTGSTRIDLDCHAQSTTEGLERRFSLMMRIGAAEIVDVQRDLRVIDETLEEFANEIHVEVADARPREFDVELEPWTAGEIDDDARQRFVERHVSVPITANRFFVPNRF